MSADPIDVVPSNRVKRHYRHLQRQPEPDTAGYVPPDDTYAPTQEHGGRHIAAAMVALEAGAALEDERKKLEALVLSKQARIEALQAEIRDIEDAINTVPPRS